MLFSSQMTLTESPLTVAWMVEVRGIEPLSEDTMIQFSPSEAHLFKFPYRAADERAARVGSFILPETPQSFDVPVPHINGAGEPKP